MKVYGQLEVAQLEQIAATTATPTPTGRIYIDVTNPLAAIPRFFNGTSWLPLMSGTPGSTTVSQNSGTACTVNWATGLIQQVILTGHCLISFSNPIPGQQHYLIVTQNPETAVTTGNTLTYSFKFNMPDQDARRQNYQPSPPVLQASANQLFSWFYYAGIKPGYATMPNLTLAPNTAGLAASCASSISPDGKYYAQASATTPFGSYYPIFDGGSRPTLGQRNLVTPPTPAGSVTACDYSPDNNMIFYAEQTTPFAQAYFLDRGTAAGTAMAPTALAGAAQTVQCNPQGNFVAYGHATTPFMSIIPYTSSGFGTKLTNPSTLPPAQVNAIAWSPFGDFITIGSGTTPFIQTWPFNPFTGVIGTVVPNPTTLPAAGPRDITVATSGKQLAWRPQGDYIAMTMGAQTPFLYVVPFSRTTGAYGTPLTITAPATTCTCVAWTPDGQYLLVGMTGTGTSAMAIYDFSTGTPVGPIAFDGVGPNQGVSDITVHPSGEFAILGLLTTPFSMVQVLPTKIRNYFKIIE